MKSTLLLIGLSIGCAGCSSMPWNSTSHEVDPELVAAVPVADRESIDDARALRDKAADTYEVAKRNTSIAKDRLELAKKELDIAQAERAKAEAAAKMAEKETTADLEEGTETLRNAELLVDSAENRIRWREMDVHRAHAREELAQSRLALEEARVELARAEAVRNLDQPAAKDVDVPVFERAVRDQEKAVALAEIDVDAAENEARIAHETYLSSREAVPASYMKTEIDEEIPFETDGYQAREIVKD